VAEARLGPEGQKAAPAGRTPVRREAPRRGDAMALQRRAPGEAAEKLQQRGGRAVLAALARKLARWAADEGGICVPLPSIADAASEASRRRARMALLEVFGRRTAAEADAQIRTLLLADIRAVFRATSAPRMASQENCVRLAETEDRPWPEFRRGGPISRPQLAAALLPSRSAPARTRCASRPVGRRRTVGREGGAAEGVPSAAFEEAWARARACAGWKTGPDAVAREERRLQGPRAAPLPYAKLDATRPAAAWTAPVTRGPDARTAPREPGGWRARGDAAIGQASACIAATEDTMDAQPLGKRTVPRTPRHTAAGGGTANRSARQGPNRPDRHEHATRAVPPDRAAQAAVPPRVRGARSSSSPRESRDGESSRGSTTTSATRPESPRSTSWARGTRAPPISELGGRPGTRHPTDDARPASARPPTAAARCR
jgi:hypothetical protein